MTQRGRWAATLLVAAAMMFAAPPATRADEVAPAEVELVLFWGDGCPHCAAEKRFLADLTDEFPDLVLSLYEVWHSAANRELFVATAAAAGITARAVPTTFVGDHVWVGFNDAIGEEIRTAVAAAFEGREIAPEQSFVVDVPIVGEVDLGGRSLVISTVVIGFVDGINPCSLWVLSVLLALVLHSGSRHRVAAVGGVFLLVTSLMYGLYIVGAYSALSYIGYLTWIRVAIAVIAGVLGLLQLKEAVGVSAGPSLGLSPAARPGMFRRMRRLSDADRSLPGLLAATAGLAVGVSLLETPCTVGLPILWTDLLAKNEVPFAGAAVLFLVYLAVFLLDELVVFLGVVTTMRALKVQERHGRALKLVSGIVMVTLAVVMVVIPEAMETVGGALLVFAVAALMALVGLGLQRAALTRSGAAAQTAAERSVRAARPTSARRRATSAQSSATRRPASPQRGSRGGAALS